MLLSESTFNDDIHTSNSNCTNDIFMKLIHEDAPFPWDIKTVVRDLNLTFDEVKCLILEFESDKWSYYSCNPHLTIETVFKQP